MLNHKKLALRLLAVVVAVLTTITWVSEVYADTGFATTTSSTAASTAASTVTTTPASNFVTLNSVGWGGTTGK